QSNFQPTVTRLFGTLSGTAERIQTLTSAAYNEYISPDTLEFHYFISLASSDSGYWSANNPRSCAGWDGGPCDANTSVDNGLNGGMRDLDGLGDQLIIAGTAKVTSFDFDNDQIVKTPGNTPTVSPLFYYNGSSWSTLLFSPDNVLKDPKHYDGAPYDFVFDHVRFLSESMILVVGHYRTCLTDGCYNKLDNEVMVEVKVQPFVTTYDLTLASFGPMIPIGGGETRGCCVGGSCQSQPRCTNYQMRPFWLNSRVATVGLRQLTNGLEIYMAVNPVDPLGVAETTRFRPRAKIYSFISIAP
ncbi:MAG: hypothetical protein KC609_17785, partial [Myxococcales bacterium]|nr:hypothetical protein [Myxococcales bacterium]